MGWKAERSSARPHPRARGPFQDAAAPRSTIKPVTFCSISFFALFIPGFPTHKEPPSAFHLSEPLRGETRERALARSARALRGCRLGCPLSQQRWEKRAYRVFKERLNALGSPLGTEGSRSLARRGLAGGATGGEHGTGTLPQPCPRFSTCCLSLSPASTQGNGPGVGEHPAKRSAPRQAPSPG